MCKASKAFTLIEIMLAVAIAGIIAATALAPLVFTVKSLEDAQKRWKLSTRERASVDRIFNDVLSSVENPTFASFKIIHKDGMSIKNDDRLLVWTSSTAREGNPVSLVVYKIVPHPMLDGGNEQSGLFRWVLKDLKSTMNPSEKSGDKAETIKSPIEIDTDTLKKEDARMLYSDAVGVSFSAWNGEAWADEYQGALPSALKIEIETKEGVHVYKEWLPALTK